MHKRWRNHGKAYNLTTKKDPVETDVQNAFTRVIHSHIEEEQEKYYSAHPDTDKHLHNGHIHKCAYEIVSNDKVWCAAQCRKECKKLNNLGERTVGIWKKFLLLSFVWNKNT